MGRWLKAEEVKDYVPSTPYCTNCNGIHHGSTWCPFAVPYDTKDPMGHRRGLNQTCETQHVGNGKIRITTK